MSESTGKLGMVGVTVLAVLLRLPWLGVQSIAFDEAYSIAVGSAAWPALFQATLSSGVHPPLFYIVYKSLLPLWGTTEFGARFLPFVFGVLAVPLVYRLGKTLFDVRTGLLAAVLLAVNPLHIWLSREARMYGLLIFLTIAGMLGFWLALHKNRLRDWAALAVIHAVVFNLHYFSLWLPVIQFAVILSQFRRYYRQFRRWAVVQFISGLALLPWLVATARREVQTFGIGFLVKPDIVDLPLSLWNFAVGYSLWWGWPVAAISLGFCTIALVNGLRLRPGRFRRAQLMLVWWMFLPLVMVWIISQRRSFYADRYLSFVLPGLVLLLAAGVFRMATLRRQAILFAGLVAATLVGLAAIHLDPAFQKDDWRGAVDYIHRHEQPGDVILLYTAHIRFPFEYYYHGQNPVKPISVNLAQYPLPPMIEGHSRVWVVYPYTRRPTHYPMQPLMPKGYWAADPDRNPYLVRWLDSRTDRQLDYRHTSGIELWLVDNRDGAQ